MALILSLALFLQLNITFSSYVLDYLLALSLLDEQKYDSRKIFTLNLSNVQISVHSPLNMLRLFSVLRL